MTTENQEFEIKPGFYEKDNKLVYILENGDYFELDFDNLKNEHAIKNNIKSDDAMTKKEEIEEEEEETKKTKKAKDLTGDEMMDGENKETPADGDDDDVENKIKGDPYQDGDKKKGEKFQKKGGVKDKTDISDLVEMIKNLQKDNLQMKEVLDKNVDLFNKAAKSQEAKDMEELKEIQTLLQEKPYHMPLETIKDFTLEELQDKKAFVDNLQIIQDFYKTGHLTHEDVDKTIFDFQVSADQDPRAGVLAKAQANYAKSTDFGGVAK